MSALSQKVAAAIVGVGAVSVLATGAANAHPGGPAPKPVPQSTKVPETNCTLGQVEKALAKEDPAAWKKINSSPEKRARFENMVVLTKEQRQAKKEEWKRNHPLQAGVHQFMKDNNLSFHSPQERAKMKQERKATMEKVQATCSQS